MLSAKQFGNYAVNKSISLSNHVNNFSNKMIATKPISTMVNAGLKLQNKMAAGMNPAPALHPNAPQSQPTSPSDSLGKSNIYG